MGPVVEAARKAFGIEVTILRLLETEPGGSNGGLVTYLAEVASPVPAEPWTGVIAPHPLRLSYARTGGPSADLAWAKDALSSLGLDLTGPPTQVRTWNLSSLWRLPVAGQTAWLKVVPPFFAHEGAVLERLTAYPVPRILARQGPRILIAEIAGNDLYEADLPLRRQMLKALIYIQADHVRQVDTLLAMGLPDWRAVPLTAAIRAVADSTRDELGAEDNAALDRFIDSLPERFAAIADCGLPDTLVHGDFHAGNVRGGSGQITILDWGDSGVGHPLLDQPAFLEDQPPESVADLRALWAEEWKSRYPLSDPDRAADLLAPVAAARQAVIYRKFLDNIEPSEHVYHATDPRDWLVRTAELVRDGAS